MPYLSDNAILTMAKAVEKLYYFKPPRVYLKAVKEMLCKLLSIKFGWKGKLLSRLLMSPVGGLLLSQIEKSEPSFAAFLKAIISMTIAVTILRGGAKENVIPSECEAFADCRLLPGQDKDYAINLLKRALKQFEAVSIELVKYSKASLSPLDETFLSSIKSTMEAVLPNYAVDVTPLILPASSDSRYLRQIGAIVYGFAPVSPELDYGELARLAHGIDERIDVDSLVIMSKFLSLLPLRIRV